MGLLIRVYEISLFLFALSFRIHVRRMAGLGGRVHVFCAFDAPIRQLDAQICRARDMAVVRDDDHCFSLFGEPFL